MEIANACDMKMDGLNMDLKQNAANPNRQDGTLSDPTGNAFTILIADRNPHVRDLLKREMTAEGYGVVTAKDGREVLEWLFGKDPLHLLILDLDLPDALEAELIDRLNDRIPQLPVVLHSLEREQINYPRGMPATVFVEKRGNSVENLKEVVSKLLNRSGETLGL